MNRIIASLFITSILSFGSDTFPGIATGSTSGTYIRIGEDIARICKESDSEDLKNINIIASSGSFSNLKRLMSDKATHLAIIQHDVIGAALNGMMGVETKKNAEKVRCLIPLYNEELHIIVNKNSNAIKKIEDLNGKTVGVGDKKSGTSFTCYMLEKELDLDWNGQNVGLREGLDLLKRNEISALFYVGGHPVPELEHEKNLKLLSLNSEQRKNLHKTCGYSSSSIPPATYSFQTANINTISPVSMLVSYNYKEHANNKDFQSKDQWVMDITNTILENLDLMKTNTSGIYHDKWAQVLSDKSILSEDNDNSFIYYGNIKQKLIQYVNAQ